MPDTLSGRFVIGIMKRFGGASPCNVPSLLALFGRSVCEWYRHENQQGENKAFFFFSSQFSFVFFKQKKSEGGACI
jgi:hypothetical protein